MECLSEFLDRKVAMESGWGGQGEVKALLDDRVSPVFGEEDYQREEDQWIQYKLSRNFFLLYFINYSCKINHLHYYVSCSF